MTPEELIDLRIEALEGTIEELAKAIFETPQRNIRLWQENKIWNAHLALRELSEDIRRRWAGIVDGIY